MMFCSFGLELIWTELVCTGLF